MVIKRWEDSEIRHVEEAEYIVIAILTIGMIIGAFFLLW